MQATESLQIPESIGKRVDPTYSKVLQLRLKELLNSQNDRYVLYASLVVSCINTLQ